MSYIQAVVLGLVQGLGEFLPISSSGHLILVPRLFGWLDQGLAYDVALHWGTLLALAAYFGKEWLGLIKSGFGRQANPERSLFWSIALATIPAALAGLLFGHAVEKHLRSPAFIGLTLLAFGLILGWADRRGERTRGIADLGWRGCLWIGAAQALAIVPGVSRSGITLTAGLLLGLRREDAARFSFMMSAPIVLAAGILKLKDLDPGMVGGPFWAGIAVSALSGLAAIWGLLRYLRTRDLMPFVAYRAALGLLLVWLFR